MGIAAGFLASPMLVGNHEDLDRIGADLTVLFRSVAVLTTFAVVMVILCKYKNQRLL